VSEADVENLALFYRTLSTEQLVDYRAQLRDSQAEAERRPHAARRSKEFCTTRIAIITRVLGERGIVES
jgi:TorA maturation chaperone TorD